MQASDRDRFAGLDLLRGVAALSVLAFHLPWPAFIRPPLPRGYLAVDLFFMLSGFVIAHAYGHRLGTVSLFKQYLFARLIRLYPLYCAATLFAAAELAVYLKFGSGTLPDISAGRILASLATALLFLPTPSSWSVAPLGFFPLVFTAWSLFWEVWVNILYGIVGVRLRSTTIALFITLGAAGMVVAIHEYGLLGGADWDGAWAGGPRALFSFFVGVLLFRVRQRYRAPATPVLLLALLLLLAFVPGEIGGWVYNRACIALLFPLLVWLAADAAMGPQTRAAGNFLGYLSYPIYLLQAPFFLWLAPVSVRLDRAMPTGGVLELVLYILVIVAGSWAVARWFDTPVREWLRRRIAPEAAQPRAQSAP